MPIQLPISGLRPDMPRNLVLDAGIVVKNINLELLRDGGPNALTDAINPSNTWVDDLGRTATPTYLGITRGGSTFMLGKTERQVEFDSKRTDIVDLSRIDEVKPALKVSLLEMADGENLSYTLGSSDATTHASFVEYQPRLVVDTADYISNIALIASVSGELMDGGDGHPMVIVLDFARVSESSDFSLQDKAELAVEVTFRGHSLIDNQYSLPVHFFVPIQSAS